MQNTPPTRTRTLTNAALTTALLIATTASAANMQMTVINKTKYNLLAQACLTTEQQYQCQGYDTATPTDANATTVLYYRLQDLGYSGGITIDLTEDAENVQCTLSVTWGYGGPTSKKQATLHFARACTGMQMVAKKQTWILGTGGTVTLTDRK